MSTPPRDSDGQFLDPSPTMAKRIVLLIKKLVSTAGAKTESETKRDGFLSYYAETHALGMGFAAGWFFGARGQTELLSLVYGGAVYGKAHAENGKRRRILVDVASEPPYALAGVVIGAIVGGGVSALQSIVSRYVDVGSLPF